MTIVTPSRSLREGLNAPALSLEHVLERLDAAEGLSAHARADCRSALRSLSRIIGRPLKEIPC